MADDPSPSTGSLEEQLVAYLDGELDAEASRHIDELLAADAKVRQTLHDLERTWDMLEEIDAPLSDEQLTRSTLEMVAQAARKEADEAQAERPLRRRRRWLAVVAVVLVAAAGGFFAVAAMAPGPDRQLLHDLRVIERQDEYRQAASVQFLHLLRDKGLFSERSAEEAAQAEASALPPRQRVERMSDSEKEQLARLQQRFNALDPAEQQGLRQLDQLLQADPDAPRLIQTLHQYHQWLKTLPAYGRAELTELEDPNKRLDWIERRLNHEKVREEEKRLGERDAAVLLKWINDYLVKHEKALLEGLPESRRARLEGMSRFDRRRYLFIETWHAGPNAGQPPKLMTDADLARLRQQLTPELRQYLQKQPIAEQWRKVRLAIALAARRQMAHRPRHSPAMKADDEHLAAFFEHGLPDWQRDRLMNLSGDELHQELLRLYVRSETLAPSPPKPAAKPATPKKPASKPKQSARS